MVDYKTPRKEKSDNDVHLTYSPKEGSIEWHKFQIQELMHPYKIKQKTKSRKYFLGVPSLRKHRSTVKERPSKYIKTQVKFHKEEIKRLKKESNGGEE